MIDSNFNFKRYKVGDALRILNPLQSAFYWNKGVEPLDIYPSHDLKTGEPVIVFVFSRRQTRESGVYDEWVKRGEEIRANEE